MREICSPLRPPWTRIARLAGRCPALIGPPLLWPWSSSRNLGDPPRWARHCTVQRKSLINALMATSAARVVAIAGGCSEETGEDCWCWLVEVVGDVLSLFESCLSIESHGSVFTHRCPASVMIIQSCCLYHSHAPDTAQKIMTPTLHVVPLRHATCTNPCKLQVYKDLLFRHSRPSFLASRYCGTALYYCSHARDATRYQSLWLLCSDWPVLCLLSFYPRVACRG